MSSDMLGELSSILNKIALKISKQTKIYNFFQGK